MFHVKPNKPGSSTNIIMRIGAKKRPEHSANQCIELQNINLIDYETNMPDEWKFYLFMDINLAKARDMTYISPEAWRKYLLSARD